MRVICAWCGKRLGGAGAEVSHGICGACSRRFESRLIERWPPPSRRAGRPRRRTEERTLPLPGFEPRPKDATDYM